jgi:tetratricopeptide (TPR) repeat protein
MDRLDFDVDRSDIQFFGCRRSGIHGVADWVLGHFLSDKAIYNNVQLLPEGKFRVMREHIDFVVSPTDSPVLEPPYGPTQRLVVFEDVHLKFIQRHLRKSRTRILLLRDPFNMLASRLAIVRQVDPESAHFQCNNPEAGIYLWKIFAKEFMGETDYLGSNHCNVLKINFNEWYSNSLYREGISNKAGWPFTDEGFNSREGWKFSHGSSFENVDPKNMGLLHRWEKFADDEEYRSYFDDEVFYLCETIFGWVPDFKPTHGNGSMEQLKTTALIQKTIETVSQMIKDGKNVEAEPILLQALKVNPDSVDILRLLGVIESNLGRYDDATKRLEKAIEINPDDAPTHTNLSLCYTFKGEHEKALKHAQKAVDLEPEDGTYLNNLGLQFKKMDEPHLAIDTFLKVLSKRPDPYAMVNLASSYTDVLNVEVAQEYLETAIDLNPDLHGAHVNLAYCYLIQGKWEEGYKHLEHRLFNYDQMRRYLDTFDPAKLWDGKVDIDGKRVVVYGEQGFGDTIQYARYLPKLKALGADVTVCCSAELVNLMSWVDGQDHVVMKELAKNIVYDYHLPILSLPYLLNDYVIDGSPYIFPQDKIESNVKCSSWKLDGAKNIGICWRGSQLHPEDKKRSIPLAQFYDLCKAAKEKDYNLWSLQKKHTDYNDVRVMGLNEDAMELVEDFADTASFMINLDLVITADTSILHLAGAMGKPTYALIPYKPDWRWGLEGTMTPWYRNVELVRQVKRGDWQTPIARVISEL